MKKIVVAMIASSALVMAQANSLSSAPVISSLLVNAQSYPASSKPIKLHINIYDLETKGDLPEVSFSGGNNELAIDNWLEKAGSHHLIKSTSLQTRSEVPIELSNIKPIPYMADCTSFDGGQLQCKPMFADTGLKINLTVILDNNGFCMLDSDLTYMDVSEYSSFEFAGNKFEIPQIKEHRQKRSSLMSYGKPIILTDKKDDNHYRIAIISVDQLKETK